MTDSCQAGDACYVPPANKPESDPAQSSTAQTPATASEPAAPAPTPAVTPNPAVDPATILPPVLALPHLLIEYCDRCRWSPRAAWTQTELFLTFPPPVIGTISLQPHNTPDTGGRFRVWLDRGSGWELVWDRKSEGGFPELKVLKQRVRNLVQPDLNLGHSDVKGKHS